MKKSEFKKAIKEEIIDILEADAADIKAQQDLNKELELSKTHAADLGDALSEGNDTDKSQDDGYVNHTYDDSVIDKYNVPVEPTAVFEEDEEYNADGNLVSKSSQKTKDRLAKRKSMADFEKTGREFKDIDDKEPKAKDLKGEPLSKIGYKLADTQKEMKQVVKKYSAAEGDEKEKLKDRLRELNKIKKELESLLESKR
jgi:hypothetical protein